MTRKSFIKTGSAAAAAAGFAGCMTANAGAGKLALLGGTPVMGKEFAKQKADIGDLEQVSLFRFTVERHG